MVGGEGEDPFGPKSSRWSRGKKGSRGKEVAGGVESSSSKVHGADKIPSKVTDHCSDVDLSAGVHHKASAQRKVTEGRGSVRLASVVVYRQDERTEKLRKEGKAYLAGNGKDSKDSKGKKGGVDGTKQKTRNLTKQKTRKLGSCRGISWADHVGRPLASCSRLKVTSGVGRVGVTESCARHVKDREEHRGTSSSVTRGVRREGKTYKDALLRPVVHRRPPCLPDST